MTRREWIRMGAGAAAVTRLHGLAQAGWVGAPVQGGGARQSAGGAGTLKAHAQARGLHVGCAVNTRLLGQSAVYRQALAEQFDMVVAENAM